MSFSTENIDRAIVLTQHDLRAFVYFGLRIYQKSAKTLDALTCNFMAFAAGYRNDKKPSNPEDYVGYFKSSFGNYLAMCEKLYESCDEPQKEAIQIIIRDIIKQNEELKVEGSNCLLLEESNSWGKAVLCLAEVFEVDIKEIVHS